MKRMIIRILAAALLTTVQLTACGGPAFEEEVRTGWTVEQMAQAVWNAGSELEGTALLPGDALYESYLTGVYGLDARDVAAGTIWAAGGTSAQEAAVLQLEEGASVEEAAAALRSYLERRAEEFTGYLPEETALLEEAGVVTRGSYVALLACGDMEAAAEAFDRCFTEEPPEDSPEELQPAQPDQTQGETAEDVPAMAEPSETDTDQQVPEETPPAGEEAAEQPQEPEAQAGAEQAENPEHAEPALDSGSPDLEAEPWSYDESRLLAAWEAGDWSGLAAEDQAILDLCREVIETVVPADGSEYKKELAVHDWMVDHGSYDSNTLSQLPDFQETPHNDNPYGFLVSGKGICLGYASTFQLFMDLLDIECITVEGTANYDREAHAWNQVGLDGEWYCVDVTWDDPVTSLPVSERSAHRFFNVTSDFMRLTDHHWDASSVPEAEGTAYSWR